MLHKKGKFLEKILRLQSTVRVDKSFDYVPHLFKKSFVMDCSSTEENINAVECIEYGEYVCKEGMSILGLKVKGKNISLVELCFDCIEDNESVMKAIMQNYPNISEKEIRAVLRFITIVLSSAECEFLGE